MADPRTVLVQTAAPNASDPLVTLAEAKTHLNVQHDDDDAFIQSLISSATKNIDGGDGWLGRALVTQEWEMRLDGFLSEIRIPLPPLISIDSVKYIDTDGAEQTLAGSAYETVTGGAWCSYLRPVYGTVWPAVRCERGAVRIAFTAGYGDAADVPEPIKHAVKLMAAHWYRQRETVAIDQHYEVPLAANALLAPYRVSFF